MHPAVQRETLRQDEMSSAAVHPDSLQAQDACDSKSSLSLPSLDESGQRRGGAGDCTGDCTEGGVA